MTTTITQNGKKAPVSSLETESAENETWDCAIAIQVPIIFSWISFIVSLFQGWKIIKSFSQLFRGSCVWPEFGTWINSQGRLVWDLNIWIKSSTNYESLQLNYSEVKRIALEMKKKLHQEAVVIEVNNEIHLL